jgi:hypothetical protein
MRTCLQAILLALLLPVLAPGYEWSPAAVTCGQREATSVSGIRPQGRLGMAWTPIAVPDSYPRRLGHGCCWDPVHDQIYMYGGSTNGSFHSHSTLCDRYDPVANRWTSVAPMLTARNWIKGLYARGKVYAICGMDSNGDPLTSCEAYDIATNTWSAITGMPHPLYAYQAFTYRDSLLYVCGGDDAGTCGRDNVFGSVTYTQIYNVLTDSWTTGTDMPSACSMSDCDVIGDTIYFLGGLDDYASDTSIIKGGINPTNPTQITWSWGPRLPGDWGDSGRCDGPTVALGGKLYAFGGYVAANADFPQSAGYVFDPGTQAWDTMPTYPSSVAQCCLAAARASALEVYGLGGNLGDTTLPGYYRLCIKAVHDAGVTRIVDPAAVVPLGDTVTPSAWVENFGNQTEGFRVMMRIDSGYTNWQDVYVAPGDSARLNFSPWIAAQSGVHIAKCSTMLTDDANDTNDAGTKDFTVSAAAVKQPSPANSPRTFALDVPSPNPSRDEVTIRYALPQAADISLKLYDAAGKLRAILDQGRKPAGEYSATFDVRDSRFDITPGLYFVRLESPGFVRIRKVVVTQ